MRSDEPKTITARPKQSELLEWLVPRTDPIGLSFYPQWKHELRQGNLLTRCNMRSDEPKTITNRNSSSGSYLAPIDVAL